MHRSVPQELSGTALPPGVRSRFIPGVNGLTMHVLEAGFDEPRRPCVLLLHGFPELAYSWRAVMPLLAAAGYHVVAPDQRGYGATTGSDTSFDGDWTSCRMLNLVHDALALAFALGRRSVHAVVGHDFGSPVAAWCATVRPDVFRSVVLMSAPFAGPSAWTAASEGARAASGASGGPDIHAALLALPRPRQHYQRYYSTRAANPDMRDCPQGVHDFLRAYYHVKSADWAGNHPAPLPGWTAQALARLPDYYLMPADCGMAQTVAPHMPSAAQIRACRWLTDEALRVYSATFQRTGFQGGLNWYRCATDPRLARELELYAGRTLDVPAAFIAGRQDWGVYQKPGDFETMQATACTRLSGCHWVEGAGHWVQQEQADAVSRLLLAFFEGSGRA